MSHIETLIMNEVRKALQSLERSGVGYIDCDNSDVFYYVIDGRNIRIEVSDVTVKGE